MPRYMDSRLQMYGRPHTTRIPYNILFRNLNLICIHCIFRWIILIQKVTVLFHRNVYGNPQPLINIEKKEMPLKNLNVNKCPSRVFYSVEQLENNLINVNDLTNLSNG